MHQVYQRPRRTVYNPGYFGLGQPRRSVYTPGYFGLAQETPGEEATDEIMEGYLTTWGWDAASAGHPVVQGPLLPSGEFHGEMPDDSEGANDTENGENDTENGEEEGTGPPRRPRAGTPALEQIAIWGTVGLAAYFLVGPFLGLKQAK